MGVAAVISEVDLVFNASSAGAAEAKIQGLQAASAKAGAGTSAAFKSASDAAGDLSEKLDKKLEKSVGRAFKATDRLQSILGQIGTVVVVAGAAITALSFAANAMFDAFDQGARDIQRAEDGLLDVAKAAQIAKAATVDMQQAIDKGALLSVEVAIKVAKVRAEIEAKAAQRTIFLQRALQAEGEASFFSLTKTDAINEAVGKKFQKQFKLGADARNAEILGLTNDLKKLLKPESLPFEDGFSSLAFSLNDALKRMNDGADGSAGRVSKRFRVAAKETSSAWVAAAGSASEAWGLFLDTQLDDMEALNEASRVFAESQAFGTPIGEGVAGEVDALSLALNDLSLAFESVDTSAGPFASAISGVTDTLAASADASLNAAVSAIAYGGSLEEVLNKQLQALTVESGVQAIKQTALGFADLAFGLPTAAAHFKSAALWGAVGVAAGIGASASGGFGDSSGGGGGGASAPSGGASGSPNFGPEQGGGQTTTNISVNVEARPGSRIDAVRAGRDIMRVVAAAGGRM